MPTYSDEDLLAEIRRVADVVDADGAPSLQTFRDHGEIGARTVMRRFGSWNDAVDATGFDPWAPTAKLPRADLIDELERLRNDLGHIPTADEMDDGTYAYITYYERFGSWSDALRAVFGGVPDRQWETVSDAELRADLHRLADETDGDRPTTTDVKERGAHGLPTYRNRFGSWREALIDAGYEPPAPQGVTTDELLADLRRLRTRFPPLSANLPRHILSDDNRPTHRDDTNNRGDRP